MSDADAPQQEEWLPWRVLCIRSGVTRGWLGRFVDAYEARTGHVIHRKHVSAPSVDAAIAALDGSPDLPRTGEWLYRADIVLPAWELMAAPQVVEALSDPT